MYNIYDIAQVLTEDPNVFQVISENVEKLRPHLKDDVYNYLAQHKETGTFEDLLKASSEDRQIHFDPQNKRELDNWVEQAIDWALEADPRYLKAARKNKPLNKIRAPFVRQILKWWLDPKGRHNIFLPEDIQIVAETLNNFNIAKQKGLNKDVSEYDSYDDLQRELAEYQTEEGEIEQQDSFTQMGLQLVFQDGPWKLYYIPGWIPGEESTLHQGQTCHAAMIGTSWCVKYENAYGPNSNRELYLLVKGNKRYALADFGPSREFKDPDNRPVGAPNSAVTTWDDGVDFLQRFLQDQPAREMLFGRSNLGDFGRIYGEILTPILEKEFQSNPNLAIHRLRNGEVEQETAEALRPQFQRLMAEDQDFVDRLFTNKRLGNLKLFMDDIRPVYREWIKSHPEHVEEIFKSGDAGDFYTRTYGSDDPVEKSKGTLLWELRPYFHQWINQNPKEAMKLFASRNFKALNAFSDILKPVFLQMLRTYPTMVEDLWHAASWRYGHLGDLNEFRDVLNPYFARLNASETTGGDDNQPKTRLVYRKDYAKSDPTSSLLGEEPSVTSISMREFGTDIIEEWAEGAEDAEGDFFDDPEMHDGGVDEIQYIVAREIHKGGKAMRYAPILMIGWNPDEDSVWIQSPNEQKIERFGPFLKDFFHSMVNDPKVRMPKSVFSKIAEFA